MCDNVRITKEKQSSFHTLNRRNPLNGPPASPAWMAWDWHCGKNGQYLGHPVKRVLAILFFLIVFAALLLNQKRKAEPNASRTNALEGIRAIEAIEAAQDQTTWSNEVAALEYGQVFVHFWDRLRRS